MGRNYHLHKVEFIFCCDANFGMLPRDYDLVKYAAKVKSKTGVGMWNELKSIGNTVILWKCGKCGHGDMAKYKK